MKIKILFILFIVFITGKIFSQGGIPLKTNIKPIGYLNPYFLGNVKINDSLGIYKYFYAESNKLGSLNTTGIIANNYNNSNGIANFFSNGWRYNFAISNSNLDTIISMDKYKDSWNKYVLEMNKDIKLRRKTDTKETQIMLNEDTLYFYNKYHDYRDESTSRYTSMLLLIDTIKSYIDNTKSFELNKNSISIGYNSNNAYNNIAIGRFANSVNSSIYNIAIGDYALNNNQSYYNVAIGYNSMLSNTTGHYNTAVGNYSLYLNTTGYYNTAVGNFSLYPNTTGNNNTAVGQGSLFSNTVGNYNTAVGQGSLFSNTTGNNNTAVGYNAGYNSNATGNIFIGYNAGYYETNSNTFYLHNGLGQSDYNTGITHSLLYGTFNQDSTQQTLRINANTSNYGNLLLQDTKAFYFGDENTDGTWRIIRVNNNLEFQRRENGVWETKSTITP